ncbi:MAG: hypothetical protein KGJ05_06835, partial [Alphaproteobacteria bacterium]|nr:hypothetical protein [Alphaproteobacteria bacterium]
KSPFPPAGDNALLGVLGALAIGAISAALLPHTGREDKLMGKTSKKLRKKAQKTAKAAQDAGMAHLDNLGLNRDFASDQLRELVRKFGKAAMAAGQAAADAARESKSGK